tara:strand:+ start:7456 stop:7671 length:216 start_codon:yes stop_codon:yes gene_type:complete
LINFKLSSKITDFIFREGYNSNQKKEVYSELDLPVSSLKNKSILLYSFDSHHCSKVDALIQASCFVVKPTY